MTTRSTPGANPGPREGSGSSAERRGLGRTFANVFTANLASSLGDGIARTASPLLAARLTDDPVLIAGIGAVAMLPWLFFALPAGILVDRMDRRQALALAAGVRTLLAVALVVLVAMNALTIWWLYLVIFVYGVCETLYDGAIRAVVPSVVSKQNLPRANARIEGAELVVQNFAAAPLTSALFAVAVLIPIGGLVAAFGLAALLAALLPAVASGRQFHAAVATGEVAEVVPFRRQLADGWHFIMGNRMLRTLWFVSIPVAILFSASGATLVLFVLDTLAIPEAAFGLFLLSGAVGGMLGSVVASRLARRFGLGPVMAAMNLLAGILVLLTGLFPVPIAAIILFALGASTTTIWNVLMMSFRQAIIPGRLLGRVHGTWRTLLWGTMPIGSLLGGTLALIDLTVPWIVGGAGITVLGLIFYRFLMTLPNPEDIDNGDAPPPMTGANPVVPAA
ncbi:MFS transporter [Microcella frigidaquae]|uniref:MFS family permease n=1 Tax=Microcella frigidaquae TaxID=424758 RepID=A0A840XGB6_9MICO|nr:MFS transporter [Microcella frigidaquae]MBB5617542.1 MFS family permease [Microcella frigidaquae]NHN45793.1 MFS transporter [Microcella frigidaquae]